MSDPLSELQVLVVDDQKSMRGILRGLLQSIGIRGVTEAANGLEALAHLQNTKKQCDLIMCDLYMEKMDGMELCNRIRNDAVLRSRLIPILILTGETNQLVLDVVQQVGAATILKKPVAPQELKSTIQRLVGFSSGKSPVKVS